MRVYDFTHQDQEQKNQLIQEVLSADETTGKLPDKKIKNSRVFPRKPMDAAVHYVCKEQGHKGTCTNLSYSGIFINIPKTKCCKTQDRITMTFLSSTNYPFILCGTIVRVAGDGIGVRFLHDR